MKKCLFVLTVLTVLAALGPRPAAAQEAQALGRLVALQGVVEVGRDGAWKQGRLEQPVFEADSIRAGAKSAARILFQGDLAMDVEEGTEFKVSDLFFKARLGKVMNQVPQPASAPKAEMSVVPLTGVRGTEQDTLKSQEQRRPHYWSDDVEGQTAP